MKNALVPYAIVIAATLVLAVPCAGQVQLPPSGYDQFGIYTAPDFDGPNSVFTDGFIGAQITTYLVLTGMTVDSVGGFECRISFAGASLVISTMFPVPAVDVAPEPGEIQCGFSTPIVAVDGIAHVCTMTFFMFSEQEWLFLGPPTVPTFPGQMAYLDGDDFTNVVVMYPNSGGFDLPIFAVNSTDVIATEDASWSEVKSLFR